MADAKYKHYINRDLSWLKFNERVLEEAENPNTPLMERLNFAAIYHSNLAEFLRVRVGSLTDRQLLKKDDIDERSGMDTGQQLAAINKAIRALSPRKNAALVKIMARLEEEGVHYKYGDHLNAYEKRFLERYFERNVLPLLSPHIVDKHHPFPFLQNGVACIGVLLKGKSGNTQLGVVPASGYFERLLLLPSKYVKFTLIENLIYMFVQKVFPKHKVLDKTIFAVTRNADIDADEAFFFQDMSYRDIMEIMVKKRTRLMPIRLDMMRGDSTEIKKLLVKNLKLSDSQVFTGEVSMLLGCVGDLSRLLDGPEFAHLFYTPLRPQPAAGIDHTRPVIPQALKKDLLLSYPYEDIRTYIRLLAEAADNPKVVSIKITLYRVARDSRVIDALIRAAENGKEVIAVVELRARFDEENNIDWSKRLQENGVTVIYGIESYKVHSKLMLITMKNKDRLEFLTQVGTGNYNETTSRLYTDLSYITADEQVALNAQDVFQNLCMGSLVESSPLLLVSPLTLKPEVLRLIKEETAVAKAGGEARLTFKLNSLNDMEVMSALVEASDAGVKIQMIIRGICCLRVQKTGKTRNIQVVSIVGRYLEHARIYSFGTPEREKLYISSADFLSRNTERRVEVAVPVTDPDAVRRLHEILELELADNVKARDQEGGDYILRHPAEGEPPLDSQIEQYRRAYQAAGTEFPVK